MKLRSLPLLLPALLAAVAAAAGQEHDLPDLRPGMAPEDEVVILTLEDALRLAGDFNPSYRRARNQLELTTADRRDAWLGLLPDPELSVFSTSMDWNRQSVETDFFGEPIERDDAGTVRTSTARQSFGLRFEVDPEDYVRLREASGQGEIRELRAQETEAELRADVVAAFLEAQQQASAVELERELLEVEEAHLVAAERRFRLAREDRSEVLAAELDVEEQRDQVDQARADRERALLSLRNLIGSPELEDLEIEPVDVAVFDPSGIDPDELLRVARGESPELARETQVLSQTREDRKWGRWSPWIPSLNLNIRFSRNDIVRGGAAFLDPPMDRGWDRSLGVTLSLPDPTDYLRSRNQQKRDEVELRDQQEALREVRARLEEDVRGGLMDLERDHQRVRNRERRVELAEERLAEALDSYRLGRISFLDLQSAGEAAAEARRSALEARYGFHASRLDLERSLGVPLDELLAGEVPPIGG